MESYSNALERDSFLSFLRSLARSTCQFDRKRYATDLGIRILDCGEENVSIESIQEARELKLETYLNDLHTSLTLPSTSATGKNDKTVSRTSCGRVVMMSGPCDCNDLFSTIAGLRRHNSETARPPSSGPMERFDLHHNILGEDGIISIIV